MKTTLTEIIQALEELKSDSISDLKSEWIEDNEKIDLQSDIALLRQSIALLYELKQNGCEQLFNNIKK